MKQFTVTHNSVTSGKSKRWTVEAHAFYVEADFLVFVDAENKHLAAFPSKSVDSVQSDAVKELLGG